MSDREGDGGPETEVEADDSAGADADSAAVDNEWDRP